jgi:hypothetical protein
MERTQRLTQVAYGMEAWTKPAPPADESEKWFGERMFNIGGMVDLGRIHLSGKATYQELAT